MPRVIHYVEIGVENTTPIWSPFFFGIFSCIRCFILIINAQSSGVGVILWFGKYIFTYIIQG